MAIYKRKINHGLLVHNLQLTEDMNWTIYMTVAYI